MSLVGIALAALFVWLALRNIDLSQVGAGLRRVALVRVLSGALVCLGLWLVMGLRSSVLFRPIADLSFLRLFRGTLITAAGNGVLPLRMGELLRVGYLSHHAQLSYSATLAVVATERLFDLLCMTLLFFSVLSLAIVPLPRAPVYFAVATMAIIGVATLVLIARRPQWTERAARRLFAILGRRAREFAASKVRLFAEGLASLRCYRALAKAIVLSIIAWLLQLAVVATVLWAFDLQLPWYAPGVVLALVTLGIALPAAPGFVGTLHYFAQWSLTLLGVEAHLALSVAIALHLVATLSAIAWALVFVGPELLSGRFVLRAQRSDHDG